MAATQLCVAKRSEDDCATLIFSDASYSHIGCALGSAAPPPSSACAATCVCISARSAISTGTDSLTDHGFHDKHIKVKGFIWGVATKIARTDAATVLATVNQFNAVSFRVISTVLVEPNLRPLERADILASWLDIARELRVLKNFSSLKAIISGLQSNSVYRLRKTWALLPKEKAELFDELARIFSEDNNRWAQRELLMREGTAKFADTVGENDRQLQKLLHERGSPGVSHGTIPYLGTFLTDLTMIDTAIPDTGAANAYHLACDPMFDRWFDSVIVLDDREAHTLFVPDRTVNESTERAATEEGWKRDSLERRTSPTRLSHGSSSSSLPSLDVSLSSANSGQKPNGKAGGASPPHAAARTGPDFYIIRVTFESDTSIMLSNNKERTPQVIRNAMLKLNLDGDPDAYTLAQKCCFQRMQMLYYAVNTAYNLNFILRPRRPAPGPEPVANGKPRGKRS
ncbi:hypothetical protein MSG28_014852 [Choristoneura fumiferana]|uniref:Uncharacterized protein n=1 Tax=Choristoneura fumiferana TaxID=7141 RepID=A0ACC0JT40_CHOFU|nr:hypothetical protein MSG28_014852 [Choristoneura fumiferana]